MNDTRKDKPNDKLSGPLSVQTAIVKFSAQAVWLDSDLEMKSHLTRMCDTIANYYGKSRLDVSLNDFHSVATSINKLAATARIANIRITSALGLMDKAQSMKKNADSVTYIYQFAKLAIAGDAFPLASKFMLTIAAPRLKRASITYAAGIIAAELYKDKSENSALDNFKPEQIPATDGEAFDPIFTHFSREHLASLCELLKIEADINAIDTELITSITKKFSYYTKNYFTHIYHKVAQEQSPYRKVLEAVCDELDIQIKDTMSIKEIEEKVVARVLQETIDNLEDTKKEELLTRLSSLSGVDFDLSKLAAGGSIAALIVGNYAGFGTYLAATSALGALTSGLGITASFGVYTSMSSAIAVALGPIGFGAATAAFIATLSKSSPRKAVPAVIYIATMRAKLSTEIDHVAKRERKYKYILIAAFFILSILGGYILSYLL